MGFNYILVNGKPVVEHDVIKWAEWYGSHHNERIVEQTKFPYRFAEQGEVLISTVFLGLDHGNPFCRDHVPILYETMIFGLPQFEHDQWRYSTLGQAKTGHFEVVDMVKVVLASEEKESS
jgi:hypothetical protein